MADKVIEALDQSAVGAIVRRRLGGGALAPVTQRALPPRPAPKRRAPRAARAMPERQQSTDTPTPANAAPASSSGSTAEWRRQVIAPILAARKFTPERTKLFLSIARQQHRRPDGTTTRITLGTLRAWVTQAEHTTPRERPMTETTQEVRQIDRGPVVEMLPLEHIRESALNPRKTFKNMEELAADVRARGVLQPVMACSSTA